MIKLALINFLMIQTVLFATSISVGLHLPTENGLTAVIFVWLILSALSIIPSILVSFLFAAFAKES